MTQLTQDEKIDYIYNHIRSEKRNRIFKLIFKILIIVVIFYGSQYLIKNVWEDQIKKTISTHIWDLTEPIIKDLVTDLETGSVNWIDRDKIQKILKDNPALLDNFK